MRFLSTSAKATKDYAALLGREISRASLKKSHALVLGLEGDLGSGKTTFVQGLTKGLGIRAQILSPTFVICRSHALRGKQYKRLFHMDAYRIRSEKELGALAFDPMMKDPSHVVVIEWADIIRNAIPRDAIWICFSHEQKNGSRLITIRSPRKR
ncbi:MAG: tRNA (adenosine(37)-N6)-threonylcarbamoyltransferase complex ATPase subunit type 1 TsaE [Patescibacteria group bacterium]